MKISKLFLGSLLLPALLHSQSEITKQILVDQFGYRPQDTKIAVIANPQNGFNASIEFVPGAEYQVRRAGSEEAVYSGTPEIWRNGITHAQSGDKGWWFDFSEVTEQGTYYVYDVENNAASWTFDIHENVYAEVLKAALRMYYYNRCGMAKEAQYAGECWADGISFAGNRQDAEARDVTDKNNPETAKDMSGGWFDAGDFNKYVTFVDHVIHQLLDAYAQNPVAWTDDVNIPESGNGIPDILDEVMWEIDWLKKMQDTEDGGVHIKMGSITYTLGSPPSSDRAPRYYGPKCSSSSIATAGMFAHTAIVLSEFNELEDYVQDLQTRAKMAWNWYHDNPKSSTCDTQEIKSGDADRDIDTQKEMAVAAAVYLFALTGASIYDEYVIDHYKEVDNLGWWGPYRVDRGDALLYYTTIPGANTSVANDILSKLRNAGRSLGDFYRQDDRDLYRAHMPDAQYHWGSNSVKANTGNLNMNLIIYDQDAANHDSYEERALSSIHYMHGVNPLNMVYLSNMYDYGAENSANAIYHGWFKGSKWGHALNSTCGPAPGYVPGGPNRAYGGNQAGIKDQPPQKAYRDGGTYSNAWEITEPSCGYQSAFIKLLSKFVNDQPYQTHVASTVTVQPADFKLLQNYPNPFNSSTTIRFELDKSQPIQLDIYAIDGTLIARLLERHLTAGVHSFDWDAGDQATGVYLVALTGEHGSKQVRKMLMIK